MPTSSPRVKFEELGLPSLDLLALSVRFTGEEVWLVIKSLSPDKAPNPNGFTTHSFQTAWPLIRHDLMSVFNAFWRLDTHHFHNTNDALMVLLPKKGLPGMPPRNKNARSSPSCILLVQKNTDSACSCYFS
jgi:hypothetical protein